MITEVPFNYWQTYSCQICDREIETDEELIIQVGLYPVCSDSCRLLSFCKMLRKYPNQILIKMLFYAFPFYRPKRRTDLINKLAFWFLNKHREIENGKN